jgi:hypothetical protein
MPETRTVITVDGAPLGAHDLDLIQSLNVEEALGAQDKVSMTIATTSGPTSRWSSALDVLVNPAAPFSVSITRGKSGLAVEARAVAASWSFVPNGLSTLQVEGMDRSVEMDRKEVQRLWPDTTDATIARTIFQEHGLQAQVDTTPTAVSSDTYSPQQTTTDWAFLKSIAGRNGFDVHIESIAGVVTGTFRRIDAIAEPQTTLELGYGRLGGAASASVQLLTGQEVHVTRAVPGSTDTDVASDPGTGHAMGRRSLGGQTVVRTHAASGVAVLDAQTTATAMAERSAFGATLTVTLASPDAPLVRARRTVSVAGLGDLIDGLWLVRSVRHTIDPGGHVQALGLIRNALGSAGGGGGLAAMIGAAL